MIEKPEPKWWQQQPIDSSFKMLMDDQPFAMLRFFLEEDIEEFRELKEEVFKQDTLKPALRVDAAYWLRNRNKEPKDAYVAHIEYETSPTKKVIARLLMYFGLLFSKYELTILQVLVSPFDVDNVPRPPLALTHEGREILTLLYKVVILPEHHVRELLDRHLIELYAMLPTMQGATYEVLSQGIQEMKEFYRGEESRFRMHLLWFDAFLVRTAMVTPEDKERIRKEMNDFESLLDESIFVRRGLEKGREEGLAQGRAEGLQKAVVDFIKVRFPPLTQMAQEKVPHITKPEKLDTLLNAVYTSSDEATVRVLLDLAA